MGPVEISDRDRPFFLNRRKRDFVIFRSSYGAAVGADAAAAKKIAESRIGATDVAGVLNMQMTIEAMIATPRATRNWR